MRIEHSNPLNTAYEQITTQERDRDELVNQFTEKAIFLLLRYKTQDVIRDSKQTTTPKLHLAGSDGDTAMHISGVFQKDQAGDDRLDLRRISLVIKHETVGSTIHVVVKNGMNHTNASSGELAKALTILEYLGKQYRSNHA